MRMTGSTVLVAYCSPLTPAIGLNVGSPSYLTVRVASEIFTAAVCGMELATTASRACGVPGTDTSTFAFGPSAGIFWKSCGKSLPATNAHGPSADEAVNQRP